MGIIGGADGPTAIFLSGQLAPHLLGAIAVAATVGLPIVDGDGMLQPFGKAGFDRPIGPFIDAGW